MSSEYDRRAAILVALQAGCAPKEIIAFLKLPPRTVFRVAKEYKLKNGTVTPSSKKSDRSGSKKRSPEFLAILQEKINEDPGTSIRNLAVQMNVCDRTMRRAISEDLRCKSYVIKVRQMLSDAMKDKRVDRCAKLLHSLKHGPRRCGPQAHQIAIPLTILCGASWRGNPTSTLTTALTHSRPPSSTQWPTWTSSNSSMPAPGLDLD